MLTIKINSELEIRTYEEEHAEEVFTVVDHVIHGMLAREWHTTSP